MNQFLRSNLIPSFAATVNVHEISDDDAVLMSIDANTAMHELEGASTALKRLSDSAYAVEDTVMIAGHMKSSTNVELALLDNSINNLVAGEDVTADQVVPNMQSFEGTTVNMQGLRDMASSVWQAIKDLIKRIRDRIVKFFKSRWGDSAKLRKRLKALIERTEKMAGKSVDEAKTEIGREVKYLTVKGSVESDDKKTLEMIGSYNAIASTLFETWIQKVNTFGETLEGFMNSYDASASTSSGKVDTLNTVAEQTCLTSLNSITKLFKAVDSSDKRSPDGLLRKVIHLPGNVGLFAAASFTPASNATVHDKARLLTKARVAIEPSMPKMKELEEKADITTWSIDNIRNMCNELLSVLDVLDRYDDSKYMKDTDKVTDKITKAGDKLAKDRQQQDAIADTVNSDGVAYQQYASAFTSWTSGGIASFASNFNAYANGVTVVASKCLSNYK